MPVDESRDASPVVAFFQIALRREQVIAIPAALMRRHLEVAEDLIRTEQVTGMMLCGTCMMDLDWEANAVFYDWLERVGDQPVGSS